MAIVSALLRERLTGPAWDDWALFTGSQVQAFENEHEVLAPDGYWDPLERTDNFAAERANGRVGMMAIVNSLLHDSIIGSAWGDWTLFTGSQLQVFEKEHE